MHLLGIKLRLRLSLSLLLKKRKATEPKSAVWQFFERLKDENGVVIKGKCIYCVAKLNAHSKKYGTSSLKNHVMTCSKFPYSKDAR